MMISFDGRKYSDEKLLVLKKQVDNLKARGINLKLASIYVSTDPGSVLYTKLKKSKAESIGIAFVAYEMDNIDKEGVIEVITRLNGDEGTTGILVQKPSGDKQYDKESWAEIVSVIDPAKDVDGLTPHNLGLLSMGTPKFIPATVKAVMSVLASWQIELAGKNIVIIGASEILGKPLTMLMTQMDATVSLLHSKTENIKKYTLNCDILISATGVPNLITQDMVRHGSIMIDVGAPRGDIDKATYQKAAYVSGVPGGVGPVTIVSLLENLVVFK
ncbi:bifunctional methylenetetrahydrofolate dehydrogenase/methenyltetrahydrofolate cyclohydrolase [Candidatus Woesebacteria bacterium]|nr:MAG: bifunctional methylenetetrahydrofolate dehydrogenase/methenyltetrahydrofolate cyclohydrolase [Candidatus Woesebacteria bacterium]